MTLKISKINLVLLGMLIVLLAFMAVFNYTGATSYGDLIEKFFSNSNHSILNQFGTFLTTVEYSERGIDVIYFENK